MTEQLEIPYQRLKKETLQKAIEAFVLREGTHPGQGEFSDKVAEVRTQLESGHAKIIFDPETKSYSIIKCN